MTLPESLIEEVTSADVFVVTFSKGAKGAPWTEDDAAVFGPAVRPLRIVLHPDRTEAFTDRQSFTKPVEDLRTTLERLTQLGFRQAHVRLQTKDVQVLSSQHRTTVRTLPPSTVFWETSHDHKKRHLISVEADRKLLDVLGMTTSDGLLRTSMSDKFRQINHLVKMLVADVDDLGETLHVVDLGCGKAYLSLALAWVLTRRGRSVSLLGVDVNPHVVAEAQRMAWELGLPDARFVVSTIKDSDLGRPDLVLALHACDTASDDALVAAVRSQAQRLVVAPCCHHAVQRQLSASQVSPELRPLLSDGITRERLGDIITDTIRRDIVRAFGYDAHLEEFIALEHTAKNIVLRARLTSFVTNPAIPETVVQSMKLWHVRPVVVDALLGTTSAPAVS